LNRLLGGRENEMGHDMKRRFGLFGLAVLAAGAALRAGQAPAPQPQPPTFQAQVEYIEVDALVTDGQGHAVRDLKKDDFQILEDGKAQAISTFSFVNIPIERYDRPLFAAQPIEPDVRTNARPFDGRIYVMIVDDLHTSALRSQLVKRAAKQFLEQNFGANDLMAVVHTAGPTDASQEFTNNKRLLTAAIDRTMGRKVQSETLSRNDEYMRTRDTRSTGDPVNDPDDVERAYNARSTLSFLKTVADWFAGIHGRRKSILFVSEGIDYNIYDMMGNGGTTNTFTSESHSGSTAVADAIRDAITAATRANVSIYGIDPRGLTSLADDAITASSFADSDEPGLGIGQSSLQNEVRLSQDSLRALSDETGGFAVVNRNQFGDAFQRIVEDNSSYYELAYYPPTDKRDGKYHKIQVRVNRPGLTVRARKGWFAPKGKPPAPGKAADPSTQALRVALNSPLPVSGLTVQLSAAAFKGTAPNASVVVAVEVLGRNMTLGPGDTLRVALTAIDATDKVRDSKDGTMTLNLRPETLARVKETGVRLLARLSLPPGRYQLRYAAHESGGDKVGSVLYDLEVPDFAKAPFSMSGLVLSSAAGSLLPTAAPDAQLQDVLPGPPIAIRTFAQNDELALFAEIYDNETSQPHKVDITTTITTDEGKVVFKADDVRDSSELAGKRGAYLYPTRIPLKDLAPGSYVLKVAAHSRLGQGTTADRQVRIGIVSAAPVARPQ
jgi:VWFA-related protein